MISSSYDREAQLGQRRAQCRRHGRQLQLELRRRGADATIRRRASCATVTSATHGDAASVAGRADDLAGDELGRTQNGNNNAYCQDNEISWIDWSPLKDEDRVFFEFVQP